MISSTFTVSFDPEFISLKGNILDLYIKVN